MYVTYRHFRGRYLALVKTFYDNVQVSPLIIETNEIFESQKQKVAT